MYRRDSRSTVSSTIVQHQVICRLRSAKNSVSSENFRSSINRHSARKYPPVDLLQPIEGAIGQVLTLVADRETAIRIVENGDAFAGDGNRIIFVMELK